MQLNDLVGFKLLKVKRMCRDGTEYIALTFTKSNELINVSFTAERGSDIWTTIRKINGQPKKTRIEKMANSKSYRLSL